MRISDWSSDVCSSDLREVGAVAVVLQIENPREAVAGPVVLGPARALSRLLLQEGDTAAHSVAVDLAGGHQAEQRPGGLRGGRGLGFAAPFRPVGGAVLRSEEHTSELQSLMRISYAVFCLKKKR